MDENGEKPEKPVTELPEGICWIPGDLNELPEGMLFCPICREVYEPRYATKALAMQTEDREGREQWISGICSNKCWKEGTGTDPDAPPSSEV